MNTPQALYLLMTYFGLRLLLPVTLLLLLGWWRERRVAVQYVMVGAGQGTNASGQAQP
jgi:hypothetical protein